MSKARELANLGSVTTRLDEVGNTDGALSNRNLIINGAMQVAQRGTSFPYNGFGGANFCVDRFWFYNGGGATSGTIEQSTDVPSGEGFAYSLFNNTNASMPSGTNVELTKQGNAAPFVVGNTYTLSFWVKGSSASSGITMQIGWRNSHANGTNATQAVAAYPTFNVTTSWARVVMSFTLNLSPVSQNNVLDFEYAHPAGAKITGIQLEVGDTATPFEHRSYGDELARCQRYYQVYATGSVGNQSFGSLTNWDGQSAYGGYLYPQKMRAAPSSSYSGGLGTYYGNGSQTRSVTNFFPQNMGVDGLEIQINYSGGFTSTNGWWRLTTNFELKLDAEL